MATATDGATEEPEERGKYVCFYLHGQEFAADIAQIKETMMVSPITRVFLTPPWLSGIINLRGDIVAVIDVARFLGLPPIAVTDRSRIIVCRHRARVAGIVVDAMADLRTLMRGHIQPPPSTLNGDAAALLAGVVTLDNGVPLRVLDLGKLFEAERLRAFQREGS